MAIKTKAAQKEKEKDEAPEKETSETPDTPLPLLDLSDAAVKKLIRSAKKRGYVTHDQINSVLPSEEVTSEQIEDVLAMFSEMGINVVETEEPSEDEAPLTTSLARLKNSLEMGVIGNAVKKVDVVPQKTYDVIEKIGAIAANRDMDGLEE